MSNAAASSRPSYFCNKFAAQAKLHHGASNGNSRRGEEPCRALYLFASNLVWYEELHALVVVLLHAAYFKNGTNGYICVFNCTVPRYLDHRSSQGWTMPSTRWKCEYTLYINIQGVLTSFEWFKSNVLNLKQRSSRRGKRASRRQALQGGRHRLRIASYFIYLLSYSKLVGAPCIDNIYLVAQNPFLIIVVNERNEETTLYSEWIHPPPTIS